MGVKPGMTSVASGASGSSKLSRPSNQRGRTAGLCSVSAATAGVWNGPGVMVETAAAPRPWASR